LVGLWYPRALVICPGTLIENWKQELQRWGWWHVDAFHGSNKEGVLEAVKSGHLEIVITTYQTYKMYTSQINLIEWDCVIADECHIMKERSSQTTGAMNQINSLCRIGLSGTAIQNKYEELWTLLNWTNPGRKSSNDPFKILETDYFRLWAYFSMEINYKRPT
jgi:SNF2 family DNA or RNA helicase